MEEIKENKSTVTSYRLKEEAKNKVKKQMEQMGLTQEGYFDKVVSMMELENVKQNSIFAVNTKELQDLTQRIYNIFINVCEQGNSFLSNKDTELAELKTKYKDMLYTKDNSITELNEQLQEVYSNLSVLQSENKEHEIALDKIKADNIKQLEQMESNLADKTSLIEQYKQKNDMLLSDLQEYKQYKIEVEQYKELLSQAQAQNIDLSNTINNLNATVKAQDKELEQLNNKQIQDLEQIKKESELNIKLAVAEIKEELNNRLSIEQQKHIAEIQDYQNKYKSLLEQKERTDKTATSTTKKNKLALQEGI